jgi:hypothetical protein
VRWCPSLLEGCQQSQTACRAHPSVVAPGDPRWRDPL